MSFPDSSPLAADPAPSAGQPPAPNGHAPEPASPATSPMPVTEPLEPTTRPVPTTLPLFPLPDSLGEQSVTTAPFTDLFATPEPISPNQLALPLEDLSPSAPPRPSGKSLLREILETIILTALIYVVVNAATGRFRIEGSSMEPSMHNNQYVLVDKVSYQLSTPQRGDVIVFNYPRATERDFIKRVIGLPGETVHVTGGTVYVNAVPLSEPYISAPPNYEDERTLGPNEYYVLGDNRNASSDTHIWGVLEYKYFVGRAVLVYWPPESWGLVPHYTYPDILPDPTASP